MIVNVSYGRSLASQDMGLEIDQHEHGQVCQVCWQTVKGWEHECRPQPRPAVRRRPPICLDGHCWWCQREIPADWATCSEFCQEQLFRIRPDLDPRPTPPVLVPYSNFTLGGEA
jgi:hypothetical protein